MNIYGAGILFGLSDTASQTLGGTAGPALSLLQNVEVSEEGKEETIPDGNGATKAVVKYDAVRKATLEFVPTSGSNTGTITVDTSAWPSFGSTITITNSTFTPLAGVWIVDSWNWTRSNTKALMARISLSRFVDNSIPA